MSSSLLDKTVINSNAVITNAVTYATQLTDKQKPIS